MEKQERVAYLQFQILWEHVYKLTLGHSDISEELATAMAVATVKLKLTPPNDKEETIKFIAGISSNDVERYLPSAGKLSHQAIVALDESLNTSLNELWLFYGSEESLKKACTGSLSAKILHEIEEKRRRTDEFFSKLEGIISLHKETFEERSNSEKTYSRVCDKLRNALETIPQTTNKKNTAYHELLSSTIEASLLKLSVVRARLCSSLYDYSVESDRTNTIASAVSSMGKELKSKLQRLDTEEADIQARLKGYEQLIKIADSKGGGFSQIVKDLTQVKRDTEECRRDLRRLGWTET